VLAESRAAAANVDRDIEPASAHRCYQLSLRRRILDMQAAQHATR
jgi:hypothetical protein